MKAHAFGVGLGDPADPHGISLVVRPGGQKKCSSSRLGVAGACCSTRRPELDALVVEQPGAEAVELHQRCSGEVVRYRTIIAGGGHSGRDQVSGGVESIRC